MNVFSKLGLLGLAVSGLVMICCGPACGSSESVSTEKRTGGQENIFHDKTLREIYTLQNQRDAKGLMVYLQDKRSQYRRAAALGFASLQAPEAVDSLAALLKDDEETVRSAAAYALGQTRDKKAETLLMKAFHPEPAPQVKKDILEALGKCGTKNGLAFVTGLEIAKDQPLILSGQAWGIYRFSLQDLVSRQGTALAVGWLDPGIPGTVRFIAAHYLGRTRDIDLTPYAAQLTHALHSETDPFTRIALVLALGKAVQSGVLQVLTALLTDAGEDYRIKVNSLRALARFNYNDINDLFLSMVSHDNVNIAVTAAEYFLANGRETDAGKYWETARNLSNWRPRALMLAAALKSTPAKKEKEKISARIRTIYQKSGNNYEKAFLLKALAGDPGNYPLLEQETFAHVGKEAVISSYGIEALVEMSRSVKNDKGLLKIFAAIFQKAVESGDPALILSAAAVLRDPDMNFKDIYTHFDFLTTAMAHCKLPQDLEGWLELRKTRDFFKGTPTAAPAPPLKNHPLDWKLVTSIPANQRVRVKTTKGDIILQLKVNEAPGSVSTFVGLIKANFYQTSVFHRVVPNFVIQDGCPRGDGVGGPAFTIGSELGPLYYEEGSVGMASVGKDTEGSQWFITHAPTPHLDGRYSIFASVVAGMEVVHQIEIGDRVLGFEWISSP